MFQWLIREMMGLAIGAAGSLIDKILLALNFDLVYFTNQFSIVANSYRLFQTMGLGFVMLFLIWQCLKTFGAPIGIEGDDPVKVFFKSMIAVFCIYRAQELFDLGFSTLYPVFNALNSSDFSPTFSPGKLYEGGLLAQIVSGVTDISLLIPGLNGVPFAMLCVYAVLICIILYNLLKMLIEITERYILIGILAVTSPLGFSTMTNKGTANIFSAWLRMIIGQFVIYLLNIWILRMFLNAFAKGSPTIGDAGGIVWLIFMWAFIRVAQKLDQFLGKLGIEVGNAGGPLVEELMVAKSVIGGLGKIRGGGGSAGTSGGKGGGIAAALGAAASGRSAVGAASNVLGGAIGSTVNAVSRGWASAKENSKFKSVKSGIASGIQNKFGTTPTGRLAKAGIAAAGTIGGVGAALATNAWKTVVNASGYSQITGAALANKINKSPSSGGILSEKELKKLKNPDVAANMLGNLTHSAEYKEPKEILKTFMGGRNLGELTPDILEDPSFECKAYNGGISWSYNQKLFDKEGKEAFVKEYKGVVAVQGNNDATRHLTNMRNNNPGATYGSIKQPGGRNISFGYTSNVKTPPDIDKIMGNT